MGVFSSVVRPRATGACGRDAILRAMQAAEIASLKLLLVHAKDEAAADYYRKHGFEPVLGDPLQLFLPIPLST